MELEAIMISDTHQVQKNKYCVITLIEGIHKVRVEWWLPEAGGVRRRKWWEEKDEWVLVMLVNMKESGVLLHCKVNADTKQKARKKGFKDLHHNI